MKIHIKYRARYEYEEKASFSPHLVRLFPRSDLSVKVESLAFRTNDSADVQHRQDLFDNLVAFCFYPEPLEVLEYDLDLHLTIAPKNAFHFLLERHAIEVPFNYKPEEAEILAPYLTPRQNLSALPAELERPSTGKPTVERLVELNSWFHDNIAYERRDEGDAFPPEETLRRMSGSCRDYAVLLVEVLRHWGIAARLASGFLWESETPKEDRRAENALHAWVQAYLPGAGWLGLDPTNGVFSDHHFLAAAVGLNQAQIAPVSGHYYGKKSIGSRLDATLSITEE